MPSRTDSPGRSSGARQSADAIAVLVLAVLMALSPFASADHHVRPPEPRPGIEEPFTNPDPGAQLWRDVRGAVSGTSQARGMEAGVLVDDRGEAWRTLRDQKLYRYAATFLGIMLGMVVLYHLLHGGASPSSTGARARRSRAGRAGSARCTGTSLPCS